MFYSLLWQGTEPVSISTDEVVTRDWKIYYIKQMILSRASYNCYIYIYIYVRCYTPLKQLGAKCLAEGHIVAVGIKPRPPTPKAVSYPLHHYPVIHAACVLEKRMQLHLFNIWRWISIHLESFEDAFTSIFDIWSDFYSQQFYSKEGCPLAFNSTFKFTIFKEKCC